MPWSAAFWLGVGRAAAARLRAASEPEPAGAPTRGREVPLGQSGLSSLQWAREWGHGLRNPDILMSRRSKMFQGAALERARRGACLWHCWVPWAGGWLCPARCSRSPSDQQLRQLLPPCCRCLPGGPQQSRSAGLSRLQRPSVRLCLAGELSSGPLDAPRRVVCRAGR